MKISRDGNELVVRIPLKQKENNCYMDDVDLQEVDNLIGIADGDRFSLSQSIDLSYKGDTQEGMPILMFDSEDDLREVCKEFSIDFHKLPLCAYCEGSIRGTFTMGKLGNMCYSCELNEKKTK